MSYKSLFILPSLTKKTLSDHGWDFESKNRLPRTLENEITKFFNLNLIDEYLDVSNYGTNKLKVTFIKDDNSDIEIIYFRVNFHSFNEIKEIINFLFENDNSIEIFIPSQT
ncbi:hypothetical protein [Obesumbacterium proteus]|uniref:hypothetical protein n=1 Tax=Obesumbacterium proteus TaxID=82983 RepID=UPI001F197988|nr:hypothetical protein [Obesumbacterium proteus]MCE9886391.1 hypothetical protein [Obesumbacterium proteus]MCE9914213.1 hypothetical protein [Obesumbacterium proteus]MCE9929311.1 hypothetical protein [Obesumbacterium proteus]